MHISSLLPLSALALISLAAPMNTPSNLMFIKFSGNDDKSTDFSFNDSWRHVLPEGLFVTKISSKSINVGKYCTFFDKNQEYVKIEKVKGSNNQEWKIRDGRDLYYFYCYIPHWKRDIEVPDISDFPNPEDLQKVRELVAEAVDQSEDAN